ncbi:MAG: glutamate racemase, partial [Thermodesulfobacteriota bacterium]
MIGIFDSGVGGMTVAHAIEEALPDIRITYFGDLARSPYGSKSPAAIRKYAFENTEFLISKGARIIVVACNSAASVAADELKQAFNIPFFEVITPAVRNAVSASRMGRIGIIGTRATVASAIYERKIRRLQSDFQVFSKACPLLVPLVEEGWLNKQETKMIIRRYLHGLKIKQVDTLVLACTHYPLLKKLIQPRIGKQVKVIDSAVSVAEELKAHAGINKDEHQSSTGLDRNIYYLSDITEAARQTARRIFGREINLQSANGSAVFRTKP